MARRGLGRGLAALIPGGNRPAPSEPTPEEATEAPAAGERRVPLDQIVAVKVREQMREFGDVLPRNLYARTLEIIEKPLIEAVLERTNGNQLRAAEILGINRNTLRKKIGELGIELKRSASAGSEPQR